MTTHKEDKSYIAKQGKATFIHNAHSHWLLFEPRELWFPPSLTICPPTGWKHYCNFNYPVYKLHQRLFCIISIRQGNVSPTDMGTPFSPQKKMILFDIIESVSICVDKKNHSSSCCICLKPRMNANGHECRWTRCFWKSSKESGFPFWLRRQIACGVKTGKPAASARFQKQPAGSPSRVW